MFVYRDKWIELNQTVTDLREENQRLKEACYKSGNKDYQDDAREYAKAYHRVCRERDEAMALVAGLKVERDRLQKIIDYYHTHVPPELESKWLRDEQGRRVSESGDTKEERAEQARKMFYEHGKTYDQIAQELGLSRASAKVYVSEGVKATVTVGMYRYRTAVFGVVDLLFMLDAAVSCVGMLVTQWIGVARGGVGMFIQSTFVIDSALEQNGITVSAVIHIDNGGTVTFDEHIFVSGEIGEILSVVGGNGGT